MDAIKDRKSTNLDGIGDFLGTKKQPTEDKKQQTPRLQPLPGNEPAPVKPPEKVETPKPVEAEPTPDEPIAPSTVPDDLFEGSLREAPAQPAPAAEPEISDEDLKKWEPKQAEAFKTQRLEIKRLQEALNSKGAGQPSEEQNKALEEANRALAEAHNTIARLNLAEDPRFKAKYDSQIGFLVSQIKEQATALEYDEKAIDILAGMGLKDRMHYISENLPMLKEIALPLFTQIDMLKNARQRDLENASANRNQMMDLHQKQIREVRGKALESTVATAQEKGHFLFRRITGNDAWNKAVDANIARAASILESNDTVLQTEAIVLGAVANEYLKLYQQERQARITATNQLRKFQKAGTHPRNPDGASDTTPPSGPHKAMSGDQMLKELEKKKARRQQNQ